MRVHGSMPMPRLLPALLRAAALPTGLMLGGCCLLVTTMLAAEGAWIGVGLGLIASTAAALAVHGLDRAARSWRAASPDPHRDAEAWTDAWRGLRRGYAWEITTWLLLLGAGATMRPN